MNHINNFLKTFFKSNLIQKDAKNFIEFALGYAVASVVGFFLVRIINLSLTQEDMGKFSFIASLVAVISPILYLSAPQAYLRFQQEHEISKKLREFILPFFYFSVFALAIVIWFYTRSWLALAYAALPLFTEKTYLLRCQMHITKLNALKVLELLLPLVILLILRTMRLPISADLVLFLYGVGYLSSCFFRPHDLTDVSIDKRKILKYLIPTIFTALFGMFISNSAVFFSKVFFGYETAGLVGVAVKALVFLNSLFLLFLMFYPVIYMREAEKKNIKIIRLYRTVIMMSALLACVGFSIFSKQIYWLLGAEKYSEYSYLFVYLVWITFFNFVGDIYWLYFAYEIKTWKSMLLKGITFFIIVAGIPFANRFGLNYIFYLLLFAVAVSSVTGFVGALYLERKNLTNSKV